MKYLLDTNIIIRWLENEKSVGKARTIIQNKQNLVYFSSASVWEIAIKTFKSKLKIKTDFVHILIKEGFTELPIQSTHALATETLPHIHSDPFDRIILAQAVVEQCILITTDKLLKQYNIPTLLVT